VVSVVLLVVVVCALSSVEATTSGKSKFPVPSYYVFGDSYHDAGNNNYLKGTLPKANFSPYGITYFKGVATGRFCDGRIIPDFLAQAVKLPLAKPDHDPTLTLNQEAVCVNYASGGAGILAASTIGPFAGAIPFSTQLSNYENVSRDIIYNFGFDAATLILNDAIYQLNIGTVDLLVYFTVPAYQASSGSVTKFVASLAAAYKDAVTRLYNQGARKVVVFGIGPVYKTPLLRLAISQMTAAKAAAFIKSFDGAIQALNTQLLHLVTSMPADDVTFPMLTMVYIDTYGAVNDMIEDSARYGISDAINACCGAGKFGAAVSCGAKGSKVCKRVSRNLFWDNLHYTESTYKKLFSLYFNGSRYVKPMSLKALCKLLIPGVPY